jgi:hypothetical protein
VVAGSGSNDGDEVFLAVGSVPERASIRPMTPCFAREATTVRGFDDPASGGAPMRSENGSERGFFSEGSVVERPSGMLRGAEEPEVSRVMDV